MTPRFQGLETEYGFAVLPGVADGGLDFFVGQLILGVGARVPGLPPVNGNGWFLANGGRFYIDTGYHPEYCTPECAGGPFEVVRYMLAGDRLLESTAAEWTAAQRGRQRMVLFKSNVDYTTGKTWACHESYSHRSNPLCLPADLIPHLVSRVIYCGAGGLRPEMGAIEFCLAPRLHFLTCEVSSESTHNRGIFHTRDESLAGPGWHRLHVLAGESLCSHRASVLKLGTTALVLALAEAELRPGQHLQFVDALAALATFNGDLALQARVPLRDGRGLRALDVQRHYLAQAQAHLASGFMPPWASRICELWHDTLNRLERGPDAVAGMLDWAMKWAVLTQHIRRRGCDAERLSRWNNADRAASSQADNEVPTIEELVEFLTRRGLPVPHVPAPAPEGLPSEEIAFFEGLRAELAELEIRFSQLGEGGLFHALDRQGTLDHRLPDEISDAAIQCAMQEAPSCGRASVRGSLIRALTAQGRRCACNWHFIRDAEGQTLDLADPSIEQAPAWQKPRPCVPTEL
jgi:hypothetical protein